MMPVRCEECGGEFTRDGDSCTARFDALLALDHSRREPWGSRHGQAFAAFALQHPRAFAASLDGAWGALRRIYVDGESPERVFRALVSAGGTVPVEWKTPPRPARPIRLPAVTIADLADFAADDYPVRLDAWCLAALEMWG